MVLPGNFLPLLEEAQTISQVDFVFEFICSKVKGRVGEAAFPVSVNFSRFSLAQSSCGTAGEAV